MYPAVLVFSPPSSRQFRQRRIAFSLAFDWKRLRNRFIRHEAGEQAGEQAVRQADIGRQAVKQERWEEHARRHTG